MNILIALDSFKGSLTSKEAGQAVAEGARRAFEEVDMRVRTLADGGEGTTVALVEGMQGEYRQIEVTGPLGNGVSARYGVVPALGVAIIEMAEASGITLVSAEQRNPLHTTTRGFGEMIRKAIVEDGCKKLILGIGGSATNDGGAGMLQALGVDLLDAQGQPIAPGAAGLEMLAGISLVGLIEPLKTHQVEIRVACDVDNPLCGPQGCSAVFGPQKGATPDMISRMDATLERFACMTRQVIPEAEPQTPGNGAAGGLGYVLRYFLGAKLESGANMILDVTRMESDVQWADLVVTGEGRLDAQTVHGKAPAGIAKLAKRHGRPVIAFAGCVTPDARLCNQDGIDAFFPAVRKPCTLQEALEPANAKQNLADTAEQVFRLMKLNYLGKCCERNSRGD